MNLDVQSKSSDSQKGYGFDLVIYILSRPH